MNKLFLSVGIIPFYNEGEDENKIISDDINPDNLYFLMIQRKDTIGYTEFIRGKYRNIQELQLLIDRMTLSEKKKILTHNFVNLWHSMWYEKYYINPNDYKRSNDKFDEYRPILQTLVDKSKTKLLSPEWGFPKGRKHKNESNIECAIREMKEETNIDSSDYKIIKNLKCLEENVDGTNHTKYQHKYFLAKLSPKSLNSVYSCILTSSQKKEVSNIGLFNYKECMNMIRDYDVSKKKVLNDTFELLMKTSQFKLISRFYTKYGEKN